MSHQKPNSTCTSIIKNSFFIMFFLFCNKVNALIPRFDNNAPIQIQSDSATFEQLSRQASHVGNVIMTQGPHVLHADKLSIKKDTKGNLTVIIATGTPATFTGTMESDPDPVFATAKVIYYYPDKQLIVLEGSATLDHQRDKFKGPMLSYQLDKQVVSATRKSQERPTITIQPRVSKI